MYYFKYAINKVMHTVVSGDQQKLTHFAEAFIQAKWLLLLLGGLESKS